MLRDNMKGKAQTIGGCAPISVRFLEQR